METVLRGRNGAAGMSSYPTYEEWKPASTASVSASYVVLILPMRNGNFVTSFFYFFCKQVLILPMRNGNSLATINRTYYREVLILPMRNGNE